MMRKTPKAIVRAAYPQAVAWHWADGYVIYDKPTNSTMLSASGWKRAARAWADAASRLGSRRQ